MRSEPIWHPTQSHTSPCIYVKQELVLSGTIEVGRLQCACSGSFQVYLNGEWVGRGLGPALTQDPVWEKFEIGDLLRSGKNVLLIAAEGSAVGTGSAWFRAEGEIVYEDGKRIELSTGSPWRVLRADAWQRFDEGVLSRVYLAAQESEAWREGKFREDEWEDAVMVEGAELLVWNPRPVAEVEVWAREIVAFGEVESGGTLCFEERTGPMAKCKCVHREGMLRAGRQQALVQTRSSERAVYLVLDFGRVLTGFPRLRLHGPKGGVVDLGFARRWGEIESGLRYVSAEGHQEWDGLRLETCRYAVVRLSNWEEEVEIDSISIMERRAQVLTRSTFEGAEGLEQIWEIGQRTVEECRQEIYFLSPEGRSYDWLRVYALALNDLYLTGDGETAAAMLDSARPPQVADGDASQALAYVLLVEAYHRHLGDGERGISLLPGVSRILDACGEVAGEGGLLEKEEGGSVGLNALYAGALAAAGRLFRALKQRRQGAVYEKVHRRVRKGLQEAWCKEKGLFADQLAGEERSFSQWVNALMLYFELAGRDQQQRIVVDIRGADVLRVESLLQAFFVVGGLWQAGAGERALRYAEQQWGRLVEREGRTWGEKAGQEGMEVEPGPEFFLGSQLLGVQPGAPGYRVLKIRPQLGGLLRASGRMLTGRGAVAVEWERDKGRDDFVLRVELAEEGETHLAVPRLGKRFPTLSLNDETVWRNEKVYPNSFVQEVISEDEWIVLVLQRSGSYEVVVE